MMKRLLFALSLPALASLLSCATNPDKIPDHTLYGDDEAKITAGESLSFALVGNVRGPVPGLDRAGGGITTEGVPEEIVTELRRRVDRQEIQFVTLMGDVVRTSTDKEWQAFDTTWREVLDGATIPQTEGYRVPVMPVAGDLEYRTDKDLMGMEGAFPGVGVDIGYNRVASWYTFDVRVVDTIWRFVILDSNKKGMGSRWNEQLYWIPRATEGRYDHLLTFMHDPLVTLAPTSTRDRDGAPSELIETIEDNAALFKLRAVFSAEPHTTEVIIPEGNRGTAHINAGGGGAPAEELERWGNAEDLGMGDIQLEPFFDLTMQRIFDKRANDEAWPEAALEKAKARGSWEGFTAAYDPNYMPLYGFWIVTLTGEELRAEYNMRGPNGEYDDVYRVTYKSEGGWSAVP